MNRKMAISVESSINAACEGVTVLLVDGDLNCLTIISEMLRRFGYKVIIAKRAAEAFCIIRDREYEIDLILAEGCLPDMDKYELLETLKNMSKLPVVLMSVDYNGNAMLGGLFKGAMLYLVKPITMDDLKYLWQFALMKEREDLLAVEEEISGIEEESSLVNASGVDVETQPVLINEERQNLQKGKRKRSDDHEMQNNEEDNGNSAALKKPKLVWTHELHNRFVQAVKLIGIDEAHPKKILQYMNVPGLKKVNVSSHLQKYRLSLKREQDAIQKNMNRRSAVSHIPSQPVLSPFNLQEGFHQFPDMQSMTAADQLDINGLLQENLSGCNAPIPSSGSACLLRHVDSNRNDLSSTINFEQQTQCIEPLHSAYLEWTQTSDTVTKDEGLVGLPQMGNSGLESLLHWPTPSDGSLLEKQEEPVLLEPLQPPSPPTQDQEANGNFGADHTSREFDEFHTTEGGKETSELFYDDDFDFFW